WYRVKESGKALNRSCKNLIYTCKTPPNLDRGIMQLVGVRVTIREGDELLLSHCCRLSGCVDHHTHRCAVGAAGEMGGLRGPPESNGPPGELCLGGAAGEPLALACGNLPVCPECAAHPAPRDGYLCGALTLAGCALTPGRHQGRAGF